MTNLRSIMMTGRPECRTMQFYGGKLFCFGTYLSIIDVSSKLATSESRSFTAGNDASAVANGNIFYFNFTSDTMVEYQTGKTFDNGTLVISENLNRNVVDISKNKNVVLQVGVNNIIYYENNSSREVSAAYKNKNTDWVAIK